MTTSIWAPSLVIEKTKELLGGVRHSLVEVMCNLHALKERGGWEAHASSWGEFCESELNISQSFASKLITVANHYLIEGGFSPDKIEGIDYECLYLAAKTEGTPEEQVAKARTLTRRELKEERNDDEPHEHEPISICKHCSIRL